MTFLRVISLLLFVSFNVFGVDLVNQNVTLLEIPNGEPTDQLSKISPRNPSHAERLMEKLKARIKEEPEILHELSDMVIDSSSILCNCSAEDEICAKLGHHVGPDFAKMCLTTGGACRLSIFHYTNDKSTHFYDCLGKVLHSGMCNFSNANNLYRCCYTPFCANDIDFTEFLQDNTPQERLAVKLILLGIGLLVAICLLVFAYKMWGSSDFRNYFRKAITRPDKVVDEIVLAHRDASDDLSPNDLQAHSREHQIPLIGRRNMAFENSQSTTRNSTTQGTLSTSIGSESKELVHPALRQIYIPMPAHDPLDGLFEEEMSDEYGGQLTPTPGKAYTRVSGENPNIVVTGASTTPQPENDISIGTLLTSDGGTLSTLLKDLDPTNSGSGSGLPLLIQRTIALQINIIKDVGSGRFGEVKLGQWRGENVAVKIFCSRDESSWAREVEIYNTNWLRHANILQYIASDKKDTGLQMELWLITEYHPFGSLYDFLSQNDVDARLSVQLLRSFANGMQFLHSEIPGQFNKPAIAHRDIKSKNVLVKADRTCVIADLGLAVRYEGGILNIPDNTRCGTSRYLPPEILTESNIFRSFEPFKMADMYSFGLVMWEILSRTKTENFEASPFEESMPYWEHVPRDPSFVEMKKVVVDEEKRPAFNKRWRLSQVHQDVWKVMDECWRAVPGRRLTAMNVRIKLDRLAQKYDFDPAV